MKLIETRAQQPAGGLDELDKVELPDTYLAMLEDAMTRCGGNPSWRNNKKNNARDLLAMATISGRMVVRELDLAEALRALIFIEAPIPCVPDAQDQLQIAPGALLGLMYVEDALVLPQPGYSFVQVVLPNGVWHANVEAVEKGHGQPLCLGTKLPSAIPVSEIIIMTYGALIMKAVNIDERDYAGVLNPDAARWWQQNRHLIPLSDEPFVRPIGVNVKS